MSTEISFNYDDVLLAEDSDGKQYYLCIYPDNDYSFDWSQNEDPIGRLITWHRYYTIGQSHDFEMPCDFWEDVFQNYFDVYIDDSEHELSNLKALAKFMLEYGNVRISKFESKVDGEPYYLLCKTYDDINWVDNHEWGYLTTDNVDEMTEEDMGAFLEALRYLRNSDYEAMAKHLPDFLFFKVYMYDHSGIALSLSKDKYPFNDPWDAGCLGVWLCTKEEAVKYGFNSDNWKKNVEDVIRGRIEEFNAVEEGNIWGFAYAPVDELQEESTLEDLRYDIWGGSSTSCWGFIGDYEDRLKDYCEEEGLTIIGVA